VVTVPGAARKVVKATDEEVFVCHAGGLEYETRWPAMAPHGYVVGNDRFYIRSHAPTPRIDVSGWALRIHGDGVEHPLALTYADLLDTPEVTSVVRAVECAGNGRVFFADAYGERPEGAPWRLGAIGVAEWTGVPLRVLLERAGLRRGAVCVLPEGLDRCRGRRPLPITKALADDTLVAYGMNGQALPPDHGFPARLLVPGWAGVASIKWLGRVEVSETPLHTPWSTEAYVLRGGDHPKHPPAHGPVITTLPVASALELAWPARLRPGRHTIRGRAWSGEGRVTHVRYSLDRGASWHDATLRPPNIVGAWVRWDFVWDIGQPGTYEVRVRATDDQGHRQPDEAAWNDGGYLYNAVVAHPVQVVQSREVTAPRASPSPRSGRRAA
jgi:sulfane dehydrogenase subunit SoxC